MRMGILTVQIMKCDISYHSLIDKVFLAVFSN